MIVINFVLPHLTMLGKSQSGLYWDDFPDMRDRIRALPTLGPCWSLEHDGQILACGGVGIPWPGVGEAWLVTRDGLPTSVGRVILSTSKRLLKAVEAGERLHRLQAISVVGGVADERLFRVLGFTEPPVPLRRFTPKGKDCTMYARVS